MKKRLLSLLLSTIIIVAWFAFAIPAFAASSGTCGANLTWVLDDNGTLTISGTGDIPDYSVSYVPWYSRRSSIKTVIIENGVTSIGDYAFRYCASITSITISSSVTSIGPYALSNCTSLTSITIPVGLISIGDSAFSACRSLTSIIVDNNNPCYSSIDGNLYNKNKTVLIQYAIGKTSTNFEIPNSVTSISNNAFYDCSSLENIIIPDSVTRIDDFAFYNCSSLTNIIIPSSVTCIGKYAFNDCGSLTSIIVDNSNPKYSSLDGNLYSKDKTVLIQYASGKTRADFEIPNSVTSLGEFAFCYSDSLTSITIPSSVTSIGDYAFHNCSSLTTVYYNGSPTEWNKMQIGYNNSYLNNATREFFYYVTLLDAEGKEINKIKCDINTAINISDIDKTGYTVHLYIDEECHNEFDLSTPIIDNIVLQIRYIINQYIYKFLNEDGTILKEKTVDYGTIITPPEDPTKESTDQYTYTFAEWDGYTEGITQDSREMVFTATYNTTVNKYTYKFLDEDGTVLKDETVDYGTVIEAPEVPADKDMYTFDYWQNYTKGMTLTEDITFTAVYKYKDYLITAEGLPHTITVTYNSDYTIDTQVPEYGYTFIGYFTEQDGYGTRITDENGESINVYNVAANLNIYPYFESIYLNKLELRGDASVMPGGKITQSAVFATDHDAAYLTATVKYPKYLNFKGIKAIDFAEAVVDSEKTEGEYKYLDITCVYDYEGSNMPLNTNLIPFEAEFDVPTGSPTGSTQIYIENAVLIGNSDYELEVIKNYTFDILPKLAESIEIIGQSEIDGATKYDAVVSPEYTSDKTVIWSVDNEAVATVTQDGVLTPVKNGTVTLTAIANDGRGVYATKVINVIAYAKITGLTFDGIDSPFEFDPDVREYTVYVTKDKAAISLTPTFSEGVLRPNGSGLWISGRSKEFSLNESGPTVITLNIENVPGMTNGVYTVTVIKRGKDFRINPDTQIGNTVILALYNGDMLADIQYAVYNGNELLFTSNKEYTTAKVMVWSGFGNLQPVCKAEPIE